MMHEERPWQVANVKVALMQTGILLERAALRARAPLASSDEIEARLEQWLLADD